MPPLASRLSAALAALILVVALPVTAQARDGQMSVREFLSIAEDIPEGPEALLRADARRLIGEIQGAGRTVRQEQAAAMAGNRRSRTCMPERARLSREDIMARFRAIPPTRRNITLTQAMREWMAERYPCED